ncbi:MAG: BMC domain-containing protein [Verrucomicrobiota bacterium]|nr:BMC domain-containing protein [Limisphaera sp.]MDW8382935.1 BMC domain-containing protein [Verrucomicrobiota bacterium]
MASLIEAAAAAVKTAPVQLLELRLAMALGGKAVCSLTGDVASLQSAVGAGREVLSRAGMLVHAVVIPRPHPELYREIV